MGDAGQPCNRDTGEVCLADVPQSEHDAAWKDVEQALKRLEGKDGFAGPNDMNLVVGRKPIR